MSENKLPEPLPRRLNVGCGWDIREGFLNVDFVPRHNPDLVADVTNLSMLPSGYFIEIVAQDVLEHFERWKTIVALKEWSRLLGDNGSIHIRTPSLLHMMDLLLDREACNIPENVSKIIHLIYGTQAYQGDYHLAGFTSLTMQKVLNEAGLHAYCVTIKDEWLFDIRAAKSKTAENIIWPKSHSQSCLSESANLKENIAAVYRSTSWRITAPIRMLRNATIPVLRDRNLRFRR